MYQLITVAILMSAMLSNNGAEAIVRGFGKHGKYKSLKGFHSAWCTVGTACQGKRLYKPTLRKCAKACANDDKCRCAIYRPADGFCSFKVFSCRSKQVGLRNDKTSKHRAISVRRRRSGAPSPQVGGIIGRGDGQPTGGVYKSTMTQFQGFGYPYGGCGMPMDDMRDSNGKPLPYIALNKFKGWDDKKTSLFANGVNCGRWVQITVKAPCGGNNDGSNMAACLANSGGTPDRNTGRVLFGFVGDSCADHNAWCRDDDNHIDMSAEYMRAVGVFDGWRNNKIEWSFLDGTPSGWTQSNPRFKWCVNAKMDWLCFIVANTNNGISGVDILMQNGGWVRAQRAELGMQFTMPQGGLAMGDGKITVRPYDVKGAAYGVYKLNKPSGASYITNAQ